MSKRWMAAVVLGGVALYIWGAVSWMFLPWHTATVRPLPREAATVEALASAAAEPGAYLFPYCPMDMAPEAMNDFRERHARGPVGMLFIHPAGRPFMPPQMFITGFLLSLATSLMLAGLMWVARGSVRTFWARVGLATLAGAAAAIAIDLQLWNWMLLPSDFSMVNALDHVLSFVIAGMAIAMPLGGPPPHAVPAAATSREPDGPVAVAGAMSVARERPSA